MENFINMDKTIELLVGFTFVASILYFLDTFIFKYPKFEKVILSRFLAFCLLLIIAGIVCNQLIFNDSNVNETVIIRLSGFVVFCLTLLLGYYVGKFNK